MSIEVSRRKDGYLPLNKQDMKAQQSGILCEIPFGRLAWATVSLPFVAFLFCVMWSVAYHFDTTIATHCRVANLLPSISAAIGTESPQREVWQILIGVHAPPRLLVVYLYKQYFWTVLQANMLWLAGFNCALSIIENMALIGLTFVTSTDNYPIHEKCFMTFIACSEIYMLLCCYLLGYFRSVPPTNIESRSLGLKKKLLITNIISFFLAGICFVRHNAYCEPYVYTFFALFEYIVVLTNMGFHMTAYYDLFDKQLTVGFTKSWIS